MQRLMDEGDRNRALADCRRHTLETAPADVAHGEHARQTGFELDGVRLALAIEATREQVHFAVEHAGTIGDDEVLARARRASDLDFTRDDEEEAQGALARFDQHLAALDLPHMAVRGDARHLGLGQRRNNLVEA